MQPPCDSARLAKPPPRSGGGLASLVTPLGKLNLYLNIIGSSLTAQLMVAFLVLSVVDLALLMGLLLLRLTYLLRLRRAERLVELSKVELI